MYITSSNIDVFPFHDNRGTHNNRLLTEQNLIKLAKHPLENESFVLSDKYTGPDSLFEFMLCGYHFSLKFNANDIVTSSSGTITAVAYLNNTTGTLYGTDNEEGKFTALQLVSQGQTPAAPVIDSSVTDVSFTTLKLDILTVSENEFTIPEASRRTIDGGVIE